MRYLFPLSLICAFLVIPSAFVKAQESGPSMQETQSYLVAHINSAGHTTGDPDQGSRKVVYICIGLSDNQDYGLDCICTYYVYYAGRLKKTITSHITIHFRNVILNRSQVWQCFRSDLPARCLDVHYKSSTEDDATWVIELKNQDEAQRVARAFEHAATLAGAKPDPFDK